MQTERLPFFVYGTLLPGQPNDHLWGEAILARKAATFDHGRLFDLGSFPMLVEAGVGAVRGQLITVRPEQYVAVLARLDALEGYDPEQVDNMYRRVRRRVQGEDGQSEPAWLYLGDERYCRNCLLIPDGNWERYSAERQAEIDDWWAAGGRDLNDLFSPDRQAGDRPEM